MPQPVRLNAECSPLIIRDSLPGRVARTHSPGVTARAGESPRQRDCRARVPPLPDPVPFCRASKAQRALTALNVRYFVYPPPVNSHLHTAITAPARRLHRCRLAWSGPAETRRRAGCVVASGQEGPGARIWRNGTAGVNRPQRWPRRSAAPGARWRLPPAAAGLTGGPSLPRLRSGHRRQTPARRPRSNRAPGTSGRCVGRTLKHGRRSTA